MPLLLLWKKGTKKRSDRAGHKENEKRRGKMIFCRQIQNELRIMQNQAEPNDELVN